MVQYQLRPQSNGHILGLPGVDLIRRLPGFAATRKLPVPGTLITERYLTTATTGIAYFRDPDPHVIEKSITRVHELCAEGAVFRIAA